MSGALVAGWLRLAAARIAAQRIYLAELDAAIGDGDHGITMRVDFQAIQAALDAAPQEASLSEVLREAGKVFMA